MRVVAWDALEVFAVVNALTMVVYLPAWIVVFGAAVGRRWFLVCAALVVVAAQLVFVTPELLVGAPLPRWSRTAFTLRLLDANVDKSKDFQHGYSIAIDRFHPDLVTFQEFTPGSLRQLKRSGALRQFTYRCIAPHYGPTGFLVASRLQMTRCHVQTVRWNGRPTPYLVTATLRFRGSFINLLVVHTLAPFPTYWSEWKAALRALDATVREQAAANMLIVGDFNATWNNRGFATLLSHGLSDAAAARGNPLGMTWPNGALVPPFVRIDHLLTGRDLAVTALATHAGFESDHLYLTATIAIKAPSKQG